VNPHALNTLLQVWPREGARFPAEFRQLRRVARALGVNVDPGVSRGQLRKAVCNLHHRQAASIPWKYMRFLSPGKSVRQQAIKIQPGATIPVAFNGQETTMYVDTARRLTFRGKPWFIELKVKLNTEHMPVILTRETKCQCLYCGTDPTADEDSCRKCGAPLQC